MIIKNCFVIIKINIFHKIVKYERPWKTCTECKKSYKSFKTITKIKKHK